MSVVDPFRFLVTIIVIGILLQVFGCAEGPFNQ